MISPEKNIQSLLYDNDCVIIPDFGGFIKRENPTVIDKFSNNIKPKGSSVFFNVALQQNDGLLANNIAKEEEISYQDALNLLKLWVKETEKEISLSGKFKFGNLGTFFTNSEGKKWFSPNPALNFSKNTFGLENIIAKTIISDIEIKQEKEKRQQERYENEVNKVVHQKSQKEKKKRLPLKIAASFLLLLGIGVTFYFITFNNSGFTLFQHAQIMSVGDSSPIIQNEEPEQLESESVIDNSEIVSEYSDDFEDLDFIEKDTYSESEFDYYTEEINSNQDVQNYVHTENNDVDVILDTGVIYTILAGAFLHEDNAQRRMEVLNQNGFEIYSFKPDNSRLTRIQCGKFFTEEEAKMQLPEVQKIIPRAHITTFN